MLNLILTRLFYSIFTSANSAAERFLLLQFPLIIIPSGALIYLAARKWNISLRKYFLQADEIAARTFGKEEMLKTLNKLDSMALPDLEERKTDKPTIWKTALPWPDLSQRIRIVQNST